MSLNNRRTEFHFGRKAIKPTRSKKSVKRKKKGEEPSLGHAYGKKKKPPKKGEWT